MVKNILLLSLLSAIIVLFYLGIQKKSFQIRKTLQQQHQTNAPLNQKDKLNQNVMIYVKNLIQIARQVNVMKYVMIVTILIAYGLQIH